MPGLAFEWDPNKEEANRRKHDVGFAEASTVFGDPLSITIPDPDHARSEERFVIIGRSSTNKLLIVVHTVREARIRLISARVRQSMKDATTKKPRSKRTTVEMKAEYDFSSGVRGKYADLYRRGVNVIVLEPELAEAFPDSKSVNDALRGLLAIATRAHQGKRV